MAESGQKRRSDQLKVNNCIICNDELDERKTCTVITAEKWHQLKLQAEQWHGLDRFGYLYESVSWDDGPSCQLYHNVCKLRLSDRKRLDQALSRKEKNTISPTSPIPVY